MLEKPIKDIVIVGGGAAGWLCAARLSSHIDLKASGMSLTLVEAPDIKNIGVGEGTWPSMRQTLQRIGISEQEFMTCCEASFKQGSKFVDWQAVDGGHYHHPFTEPAGYKSINLAKYWRPHLGKFDDSVTPQAIICDAYLAPKQVNTPDYAEVLTYGYHLNAAKFIALLQRYATEKYGVRHVQAQVSEVVSNQGDIECIRTADAGSIYGDLFIDCSGLHGLIIDRHYNVEWKSVEPYLFNNAALAMQVPYPTENHPIESSTVATAQPCGWIWDIGLASRRGIGHVFSREFASEHEVELNLRKYLQERAGLDKKHADQLDYRLIKFDPGYRKQFWAGNCLAVGMSAGFIEPLEATALVLVEMASDMLCQEFPRDRQAMDLLAKRYNEAFTRHWSQIIDFLKLHYVLSQRSEQYWQQHRSESSIPSSLADKLALWQSRAPWHEDASAAFEMFPSASYQYVLYGMGFAPVKTHVLSRQDMVMQKQFDTLFEKNIHAKKQLREHLPTNRYLVNQIAARGRSV